MVTRVSFGTNTSAWRWTFGRCVVLLLATSLLVLSAVGCASSTSSRSGRSGTSAPAGLAYVTPTAVYTVGVAITANGPISPDGAVSAYSVSPALPAGLSLETTTGIISGTPTGVTARAIYTVTAWNAPAQATATATLPNRLSDLNPMLRSSDT